MSVLNRVPYIQSVLKSLTDEQLQQLRDLMNGSGNRTELLRTLNLASGGRTRITNADKGVHLLDLEINFSIYKGYLIFSDTYCILLQFTDFQRLLMFEISGDKSNFRTIDEYLDINELRGLVNDLLGGGSSTYQPFPASWPVTSTTKAFCDAVNADASATVGTAFLGEVRFSDLPAGLSNAELKVEIMAENSKVIHLICSSGNVAPYHWEYTYWSNGTNVSGWVTMGDEGAAKVWNVEDDTNMDTFASSLKPGDMFNDGYSICIVGVVDTQNRRMVYLNVTDDNTTSYNDIYWYEGDTWLDTYTSVSKIFAGVNEVGTKLYKHTINCDDGVDTWEFSFISWSSTELSIDATNSLAMGSDYLSASSEMSTDTWDDIPYNIETISGSITVYYGSSTATMTPTSFTDTVTEL